MAICFARSRGDLLLGAVAGESEKAPVRAALRDFQGAAYEGSGVGAAWLLQPSRPAVKTAPRAFH
jgi:hypothetical protein